ncbi:hypothetical protein BpHYR1_002177 [Brachionus plicatilis]|uniref:Uncharacterized protein n=1 Tax=Brachionus plicatilis TaxID=10195 RepID=A0A3M7Q922_BRAPC|nr:hypothetical protein BpHYR1_002177 [Brachionus plicatilis]
MINDGKNATFCKKKFPYYFHFISGIMIYHLKTTKSIKLSYFEAKISWSSNPNLIMLTKSHALVICIEFQKFISLEIQYIQHETTSITLLVFLNKF